MIQPPASIAAVPHRQIGRVRVAALHRDEALDLVAGLLRGREPSMLAFCNAHTVNMAAANEEFAAALDQALVLNDGVGLDVGSLLIHGSTFPANLNGTDFTPALLDHVERPLRIFLLGSKPGVADEAARALSSRFPTHEIVGTNHGFFTAAEEDALARKITAAEPDLILVGMGHPRQEVWAKSHWRSFQAVTMCIGAFLDFSAGAIPRAPRVVRATRFEWLFRLALEPRRLAGRYLVGNARFLAACMLERRRRVRPDGASARRTHKR